MDLAKVTSSVVSNVYEDRPSTSPGSMPASARAATTASAASSASERSICLANSVCPIPTIAAASCNGLRARVTRVTLSAPNGPRSRKHDTSVSPSNVRSEGRVETVFDGGTRNTENGAMANAEQGEGSSTRHRILQVSLSLMSQKGVDGTSMRDLASAAGLNVASLYHYFPSKRELLEAVLVERGYFLEWDAGPKPEGGPEAESALAAVLDRHPRLDVRGGGLRAPHGRRGHAGRGDGPCRRRRPLHHVRGGAGRLDRHPPPGSRRAGRRIGGRPPADGDGGRDLRAVRRRRGRGRRTRHELRPGRAGQRDLPPRWATVSA